MNPLTRLWQGLRGQWHTHTCACGVTWRCGDPECHTVHCAECEREEFESYLFEQIVSAFYRGAAQVPPTINKVH